jgi:Cft2 family RNA processing exonuclease
VATLQFLGAAGAVTGSRFLVRSSRATVLVDAGLFQGTKRERLANWEPFPVDPSTIDAVALTHAHIDHSGWLPGLAREGFDGPVYATAATCDLCEILLPDAAHLQEEQARFANERGFSKHRPALPLYTSEDAEAAIALLRAVEFDTPVEIADGIVARFTPAGHILGSASVHLTITDDDGTATLLVSGDLGRGNHPLVPGPGVPPAAGTVLVESTYGDSLHPDEASEIDAFADVVNRTASRGGTVLIPAFAVDRTEVLLTVLSDLMSSGRIPAMPVHVDSPMALRVLGVYRAAMRAADPMVAHPAPSELAGRDIFDPVPGCTNARRWKIRSRSTNSRRRRSSSPHRAWPPAAECSTTSLGCCRTTATAWCSAASRRPAPAAACWPTAPAASRCSVGMYRCVPRSPCCVRCRSTPTPTVSSAGSPGSRRARTPSSWSTVSPRRVQRSEPVSSTTATTRYSRDHSNACG